MKNKNKLSDAQLLQIEKQRLKEICAMHEGRIKAHFSELRHHSVRMALRSVLPFEGGTQNKIMNVAGLLNKTVLPLLFGVSFGKEKGSMTNNILKLVRGMLMAGSFKVFGKIFSKKKQKETES